MSDWKERANHRRELRQAPAVKEVAPPGTPGGRKDTKRWCRGKVGVSHQPRCVPYAPVKRDIHAHFAGTESWRLLVCASCGKELARYWPLRFAGAVGLKQPKPDWVTC